MIMRSDGGVMDVAEVERRPILTMLSGPAAGIAGALFHENVTDGIFIEVGGTSADCSVIRRGQPQMRPARIGGHRTLLRTLDVRTLAVAGGSLARIANGRVTDVGPRSAHIAGYRYAAFTDVALVVGRARVDLEAGVAALVAATGSASRSRRPARRTRWASCRTARSRRRRGSGAACLRARRRRARPGCRRAGARDPRARDRTVARDARRADRRLRTRSRDRRAGRRRRRRGGARPVRGAALGFEHRIARDAQVISPLGVALALVRDVVERTIVDPSPADLARIRREAIDAASRRAPRPTASRWSSKSTRARNRVRATASGATALVEGAQQAAHATENEQIGAAAAHLRARADALRVVARTNALVAIASPRETAVVDARGVVRLVLSGAFTYTTNAGIAERRLARALDTHTTFGDVGRSLPDVFLLRGGRIAEFAGMAEAAQIAGLIAEELAGVDPAEEIVFLVVPKRA
jgi:N-methylhydantoinase A